MRYMGDHDWPEFTALRDEINQMFEGFLGRPRIAGRAEWMPPMDVIEMPDNLVIRLEVPGVDAKDLDVTVVGNSVRIKGERPTPREEKGKTYVRREIASGPFTRTVTLPAPVDPEQCVAADRHGVLEITLPKRAEAKTRRIPVTVK